MSPQILQRKLQVISTIYYNLEMLVRFITLIILENLSFMQTTQSELQGLSTWKSTPLCTR